MQNKYLRLTFNKMHCVSVLRGTFLDIIWRPIDVTAKKYIFEIENILLQMNRS